jgi:hypothetical protein
LTVKNYRDKYLKMRVKAAGQRRTLGYFVERKFGAKPVLETLKRYGFQPGKYTKVIVSWGWEHGVEDEADMHGIQLWDFRKILREIAAAFERKSVYFTDDTLRTLQLFSLSIVYTQITSQKIPRGRYTAHSRDSSDHHQICVTWGQIRGKMFRLEMLILNFWAFDLFPADFYYHHGNVILSGRVFLKSG